MASDPREQVMVQAGADGFAIKPWKGEWNVRFLPGNEASASAPTADKGTVSWSRRPGEVEWLRNGATGFEHGFTLAADDDPNAPRRTSAFIDTALAVESTASGDGLVFRDAEGQAVLRYDHALASDAHGRRVPLTMHWSGTGRLDFLLDDSHAEYPVMIDPTFSTPGVELFAEETGDAAYFGSAISLDGGFLAVGYHHNTADVVGHVYIFERRDDGGWEKVTKIKPDDGELAVGFGSSVALQGGRLAVGAAGYAPVGWPTGSGVTNPGAVYIFERQSNGSWPQVARATALDLNTSLRVGASVSLSGDRLAAGTHDRFPHENEAAFVFTRQTDGTWIEEGKLVASDFVMGDGFGKQVALRGSMLAVGSPYDDHSGVESPGSVYLFERPPAGGGWNQVAKLIANDPVSNAYFGTGLSVSGFRLAIQAAWGANPAIYAGAVYVFEKPLNSPWAQLAKIVPAESAESDHFGRALSLDGNSLLIGSGLGHSTPNRGRAYLYDRVAGGSWVLRERIEAFDPIHSHSFGSEVVLKGEVMAIGSAGSVAPNPYDGRVTLFTRGRGEWSLVDSIGTTPAEAGVQRLDLGASIALHDDLLLAGAPTTINQSRGGANTGAAYLFERHKSDPSTWDLRKVILGTDTTAGHFFGTSVALNNEILVVGSPQAGGSGAAYLFFRNQGGPGNWGQSKKLTGAPAGAKHGATAAIAGDVIAVGAPSENSQHGKVRIYYRDFGADGAWGLIKTLDYPSVGVLPDRFGAALCLDTDRLLVGAPGTQGTTVNGTAANVGRAYLFEKHLGGGYNFGLQDTMPQMLPAQGYSGRAVGFFGTSVALDGDMALVGEPGGPEGAGRAYVFERNSGNVDLWDQVKQLAPPANAEGGAPAFGQAVALRHGVAAVATSNGGIFFHAQNSGGLDAWGRTSHLRDRQLQHRCRTFRGGTGIRWTHPRRRGTGSLEYGGGGAIRVYEQRFDAWKQLKQVQGNDVAQDDAFGTCVAMRDGWLAVGAPSQANFTGAAYMFRRNGVSADQWGHWKKLVPADAQPGDYFGEAIALDGRSVVVGAPNKTKIENVGGVMTPRLKAGAAYVFSRNQGGLPDSWFQTGKFTSTIIGTAAANDFFGASVSVDGALAVVGMPADSNDKGRAYVYAILGNGAWGLTENLQPAAVLTGDDFGRSVAVSGETVLVGAPLDDVTGVGNSAGSAWLFKRDTMGTYAQVATLTAPDAAPGARFGASAALDGDIGAIGAPADPAQAANAGAAYVLRREMDGAWKVSATLRPSTGLAGASFGASLALQETTLVIGAPGTTGSTGAAHVYERWAMNGWHAMQILTAGDAEPLEFFGSAVAIDGRMLAIGSKADDDAGVKSGSVTLFMLQGRAFDAWRRNWFGDAVVDDPKRKPASGRSGGC